MPTDDPTVTIPGAASDAVVQPTVAVTKDVAADINKVIADIKAHIPAMRFAYVAWKGYGQMPDSKVVEERMEIADPLLKKTEPLTDDEAALLFGCLLRIAVEGGKDFADKLMPIMGRDAIAILTALGLLA